MIRVKLNTLAQKLGKSIVEIAKETGLNRNTVTALYHNKVDGIKFETIEKICSTYGVTLEDLVEFSDHRRGKPERLKPITIEHPYKQEGEVIPFTALPILPQAHNQPKEYFDEDLGALISFMKKDYAVFYWDKEQMNRAAHAFFQRYQNEEKLSELFNDFQTWAHVLQKLYKTHTKNEIVGYSEDTLIRFAKEIWGVYEGFWKLSLFIDAFDIGFDVEKTAEIKERYRLSDNEVTLLTTPEEMPFVNERLLRLLGIVQKIARRAPFSRAQLEKIVRTSADIRNYMSDYDYYKSNYSHISHITENEVVEEVGSLLKDNRWKEEHKKLSSYRDTVRKGIQATLKRHRLKQNPLSLFQKLVFWREYRKQMNLMGIHLMHYILFSLEEKTGIPYIYLKHLTFDEVENVLRGLVTREQLTRRYETGVLFTTAGNHYRVIEGSEARSIHEELEAKVTGRGDAKVLVGQVACQGYARGIARIVLGQEDFNRFGEGEILVTGMTRPEFVPLMKRAAGIVTNEGGITCHAAIVSRELEKPCIIGTQKATHLIKDGDMVEVRANHGTVRILN